MLTREKRMPATSTQGRSTISTRTLLSATLPPTPRTKWELGLWRVVQHVGVCACRDTGVMLEVLSWMFVLNDE